MFNVSSKRLFGFRRSCVAMSRMPSSDLAKFKAEFAEAKNVVVLTGAGVSAESGVPTFRGAGGYWRTFSAPDLATPEAFRSDPSLVWEFYHYRRELMLTKSPNAAHKAIAEAQKRLRSKGKQLTVITQNIDRLHQAGGAQDVVELHGALYRVRCTSCGAESENKDSPICESLRGKGAPDPDAANARIPAEDLPRCTDCGGLLRPAVVWFGEGLDDEVLEVSAKALDDCDLCLVVGTSSVVYPAAMFAPQVAAKGVTVAEFNTESTGVTKRFGYHFCGPCGQTLPPALE